MGPCRHRALIMLFDIIRHLLYVVYVVVSILIVLLLRVLQFSYSIGPLFGRFILAFSLRWSKQNKTKGKKCLLENGRDVCLST